MKKDTDDIVKYIRTVFSDTDEVAAWCDNTYFGRETRAHLTGLYKAALEACKEIERLRLERGQDEDTKPNP
jgi:hypothetical protein